MPTYKGSSGTPVTMDPVDLDEVFDLAFDWAGQMTADTDTVIASTWTVPTGMLPGDGSTAIVRDGHTVTPAAPTNTTTATLVWLYSTALGTYDVENTVETAGGRVWSRSASIVVTNK